MTTQEITELVTSLRSAGLSSEDAAKVVQVRIAQEQSEARAATEEAELRVKAYVGALSVASDLYEAVYRANNTWSAKFSRFFSL